MPLGYSGHWVFFRGYHLWPQTSHDFHRPVIVLVFFLRSHQWSLDEPPNLLCHRDVRCNCKVSNLESEVDGLLQCLRRALKVRLLEGTHKKPAKSLKLWCFLMIFSCFCFWSCKVYTPISFSMAMTGNIELLPLRSFFDDGCSSFECYCFRPNTLVGPTLGRLAGLPWILLILHPVEGLLLNERIFG